MVELETINLLVQIVSVSATAIAAIIGVSSYINSNKRAQETRNRDLDTRQAQLFMGFYDKFSSADASENILQIQESKVDSLEDFMKIWTDREKMGIWSSNFWGFDFS
ncbi:MAG: hypothetical protein NTY03_08390 [Candidatus Bathyarchaeota archaeon]|nr:hypothetical protein [Candidatus Bathyarchaeota archaeon]